MSDPVNEFDMENFQNQVLEGIERLSDASNKKILLDPAPIKSVDLQEFLSSRRRRNHLPISRSQLYESIERELQKYLIFFSKKRMEELVDDLMRDDETLLAAATDKVQRDLAELRLALLKDQEERSRDELIKTEATKLIIKKDIRKYLCPALQTASNDAYDIAKIITPILIPLILAGTIAIPLQPILFSHLAITIARMGIASLCDDFKDKDKK